MKILTLLRHAKSSWDDPQADDFERPLNPRGQRAAAAIGRELKARGLSFDAVLASPALRVVETIERVQQAYGSTFDTRFERGIYEASTETLLELVRGLDESIERVLLVGHNPGLAALAMRLTQSDRSGLRSQLAEGYPTAALAEISLAATHWPEVADGCGSLSLFLKPRDLMAEP